MAEAILGGGPTLGERSNLLLLSLTSNVLALALPLALLQVYDRILPNQSQGTALVLFTAAVVALLADGFVRYARSRALARIGARFEHAATRDLIGRVFAAPLAELRDVPAGRLQAAVAALPKTASPYLDALGVSAEAAMPGSVDPGADHAGAGPDADPFASAPDGPNDHAHAIEGARGHDLHIDTPPLPDVDVDQHHNG